MRITYNLTGTEHERLVSAISAEFKTTAKYKFAPTFAYEIYDAASGYLYSVEKDGTLIGADNRDLVAELYALYSFTATTEEYDTEIHESEPAPVFEELNMTEREELGLGRERRDHSGENGMSADDCPDDCGLTIEMPLDG